MIRNATTEDIPLLLQMSQRMHEESRYKDRAYSKYKLKSMYERLIGSPTSIVILSDHGCLVGGVSEYWFGSDKYAFEYILYVEPEHRGKPDAVALIKAYIRRAEALGALDIYIENTTGVAVERTEHLFLKLGFLRVGGKFVQRSNPCVD